VYIRSVEQAASVRLTCGAGSQCTSDLWSRQPVYVLPVEQAATPLVLQVPGNCAKVGEPACRTEPRQVFLQRLYFPSAASSFASQSGSNGQFSALLEKQLIDVSFGQCTMTAIVFYSFVKS
jgi:hypothetical protein